MARPKIEIEKETADKFIEMLGLAAVLVMILYPFIHYSDLPQIVPTHFGIDGKPDSYGSKIFVWLLPSIGILLFVGLWYLNKFPHVFNYPKKITEENAEYQYRNATKMVRIMNTALASIFCYLNYEIIQSSINGYTGLSFIIVPLIIAIVFIIVGVYFYKAGKKQVL